MTSGQVEVEGEQGGGDDASVWSPTYLPITISVLTVTAIVAFDGLALVAALPGIADDLGDVAFLPWVITAYLGTSAVAGIAAGPVIDAIGVRRMFRIAGIAFLLASALCAIAPNMATLVAFRALQGIGGGLVISVVYAGIGLTFPQRLRPRAFAANSLVWGVMGFGGPALAAVLLAFAGWRMIFLVQLPITGLSLLAGWNRLPPARDGGHRVVLDWRGIALVTGLVATSLVAVSQVGVHWWLAGAALVAAVAIALAYWAHAGRADNPLVERTHLTRFPLNRIHLTAGLVLVAGLAADNFLPLYMQVVRGRSESFAAFAVVFLAIGWSGAAFLVSRLLDHYHESQTILAGSLFLLPAAVLTGITVALGWPEPVLFVAFMLIGASIGFVTTSDLTLMQSSAGFGEMGRVNSAHQFIRTICITFAVAIGGAIILLVVDRQVGDVEVVRSVLRGDDAETSTATVDAVRDGFAWVLVFSSAIALACIAAATTLRRQFRAHRAAA